MQEEKKNPYSGKRPRPEYIPDPFQKRHALFNGGFDNNSTNPSKYNPKNKDFDFHLDFAGVHQEKLNNLSSWRAGDKTLKNGNESMASQYQLG